MRILIIRTSALGDIVHCLPVLRALKRAHPDDEIGWVVEAPMAPVLEGHPDLDSVIPVHFRQWRHRPLQRATRQELGELHRALRTFRADVALDLMGNHKSAAVAALSRARRRVGARREDRREPSSAIWINEPVAVRGVHAVDRALSIATHLDAEPADVDFRGSAILQGGAEPPAEDFLLIHPGAGWPNKRYPPRLWGQAAADLEQRTGLRVLIVPGVGEESLAAEVVEHSNGSARTVPTPDLLDLAALLRQARMVLGADSGPLHLAHALGTPVLCLMGPTDPKRSGPYGSPDHALWTRLPCSFCHKRLDSPKACLELLRTGAVADRAAQILGVTAVH